jgi:hypothetical protein
MADRRADVLRAFAILKVDDNDHPLRDSIARLFGMEWVPARRTVLPFVPSPAVSASPAAPAERTALAFELQPRPERREPPPREAVADSPAQPFRLTQLESPERRPPTWIDDARPLPRVDASMQVPTAVEPLLDSQQSRGVLSGALSRRLYDGPLDVREVIDRIARGKALIEIPRLPVPSLARGVQLLIDRGEGMAPYAADTAWIRSALAGVVGEYALEVLQFAHNPMRGAGRRSRRTWAPYPQLTPPRRGATIVVITDLGIRSLPPPARPASADEWIAFADHLDRYGCPLLALVPYAPHRWPRRLRRRFAIVEWDRRTTAGRVRAAMARGLP